MGGVHREYSIHLGEDGIYIEGGGEVIYIDRTHGQGNLFYFLFKIFIQFLLK